MKKLYAVLADIHGNWPALREVEQDARRIARDEGTELHFICLGDVLDYGPYPNECVQWVNEHCQIVVQGNHERAMSSSCDLASNPIINLDWWPITLWTCRSLKDGHRRVVQEWQEKRVWEHLALFHGSLAWGINGRIECGDSAIANLDKLPKNVRYGLFGHTHFQGYYLETIGQVTVHLTGSDGVDPRGWESTPQEEWIELPGWARALLNPGSVGQPRYPSQFIGSRVDRDNRASYMLLRMNGARTEHVQFRFQRVRYDVDETVRKLREIRWPVEEKTSRGSDITRGGEPPPPTNPLAQRMREVRERPEMLYELVERVLIPTLDPPT